MNDYEIDEIFELADDGDADAQFKLAVIYANGEGVAKDERNAVEWVKKAAAQRHVDAQFALGEMYAHGQGIAKDERKAIKWYGKASAQGHVEAKYKLGRMYERGLGVTKNERIAVAWYEQAAVLGSTNAECSLGRMYACGRCVITDELKAAEWLEKAAVQGDARAQFKLGIMYESGRGVKMDNGKAVEWYVKAASRGDAEAQFHLGAMSGSAAWYEKAAAQGHAEAQFKLGVMYELGRRVAKDECKAITLYRQAAAQGHRDAPFNLAFIAAANGDAEAQFNLGAMYASGHGASKDELRAYAWFSVATAFGNESAKTELSKPECFLSLSRREEAETIVEKIFASLTVRPPAKPIQTISTEPPTNKTQRFEPDANAGNVPSLATHEAQDSPKAAPAKEELPHPIIKLDQPPRPKTPVEPDPSHHQSPPIRHMTSEQLFEYVMQIRDAATAEPTAGSNHEAMMPTIASAEPISPTIVAPPPKRGTMPGVEGNPSRECTIAIIIFVVACAIIAGVGSGGVGSFVGLMFILFFPALIAYFGWRSLADRSGARLLLLLGVGAVFIYIVSRQEHVAKRAAVQQIERGKTAEQYRVWYNSLPPHQKIQVDNARLEEENARLRDNLNSRDR